MFFVNMDFFLGLALFSLCSVLGDLLGGAAVAGGRAGAGNGGRSHQRSRKRCRSGQVVGYTLTAKRWVNVTVKNTVWTPT